MDSKAEVDLKMFSQGWRVEAGDVYLNHLIRETKKKRMFFAKKSEDGPLENAMENFIILLWSLCVGLVVECPWVTQVLSALWGQIKAFQTGDSIRKTDCW